MESQVKKRSVVVAGHRTSVSLERVFWESLREIARAQDKTVNQLIGEIDQGRGGNLSSAIRVFVLNWLRAHPPGSEPAPAPVVVSTLPAVTDTPAPLRRVPPPASASPLAPDPAPGLSGAAIEPADERDEVEGIEVLPEWIDYNGHMNVAYYVLAFDRALDRIFDNYGIGPAYVAQGQGSFFVLEAHVTYLRELVVHDPLRIAWQLLDCDPKRLHYVMAMRHARDGFLAATSEQLALHVDVKSRRATPMPEAAFKHLTETLSRHQAKPRPEQVGSKIGIRPNKG
jgi:acyl-CoA thioester hydrolase